MIQFIRYSLFIFLLLLLQPSAAQEEASQSLVQNIASSYNSFDYDETDRLLRIALDEIEKFSAPDQIQIYQYAAFRQFQEGESFQAREYFWRLLDIDPTFTLDPMTTSPKILALFQKTKIEYLEDMEGRLRIMQKHLANEPMPWRSLIFPGWEQLHRGYRLKGALWAAAGSGCLVGLIQSIIRTDKKNDEYLNATVPEIISQKYDEYNRLYQSQYYWVYGFAAVWLASHVDAMFFSSAKSPTRISLEPKKEHPGVSLTLHF